jgi:hypothetical protein
LRLCSCSLLVALELPPIAGDEVIVSTEVVSAVIAEGGSANVVDVEVDVVGGAAILAVGATGEVLPTAGAMEGETAGPVVTELTLDMLFVEPCGWRWRGLYGTFSTSLDVDVMIVGVETLRPVALLELP